MNIKIVAGPPGAGKNTYVNMQFQKGDTVIDLDKIYAAISNNDMHEQKDEQLLSIALELREVLYERVRRSRGLKTVWVVACLPNGRRREMLSRRLCDAEVYVLKPPITTTLERVSQDKTRIYPKEYAERIVHEWYRDYSPCRKDIVAE